MLNSGCSLSVNNGPWSPITFRSPSRCWFHVASSAAPCRIFGRRILHVVDCSPTFLLKLLLEKVLEVVLSSHESWACLWNRAALVSPRSRSAASPGSCPRHSRGSSHRCKPWRTRPRLSWCCRLSAGTDSSRHSPWENPLLRFFSASKCHVFLATSKAFRNIAERFIQRNLSNLVNKKLRAMVQKIVQMILFKRNAFFNEQRFRNNSNGSTVHYFDWHLSSLTFSSLRNVPAFFFTLVFTHTT